MAQEALWSLAEQPIVNPDAVVPDSVRAEVTESLSAEMAIDRLSALGEAQVHAQLAAGDGIDQPVPGYDYLFTYGNAIADIAANDVDAAGDLARATPLQAVRLGSFMAASAIERMLERGRLYVSDVVYEESGAAAQAVIADSAGSYQTADREAAIGSAYALISNQNYRATEADRVATAFITGTRTALTDQEAAQHAAAFWAHKAEERNGDFIDSEAMDDVPYCTAPDELVEDLEERFAGASPFVTRVMDGSPSELVDVETATPLDQYRRGAVRAMAYIALATKEYGLQVAAGIPPRTTA
jgi:hypothetical protein